MNKEEREKYNFFVIKNSYIPDVDYPLNKQIDWEINGKIYTFLFYKDRLEEILICI